ncbi:GtrA family protein [Amnibacterium endophyticum]|uniref:GtrA family protein n=1 Tax=Amnibacterium endophyticum TaxID=2109337 RepID=A0ABW4LA33_9MICO
MRRLTGTLWRATLLRFAAVGAVASAFQLLIFTVLSALRVPPMIANAFGFLLSTQLNFLLSARFTWRHRRAPGTLRRRWLRFNSVACIGLVLNSALFAIMHICLEPFLAAVVAIATSTGLSYLLSRRVVFVSASSSAPMLETER